MSETSSETNNQVPRFRDAYNHVAPKLRELPETEFVPITLDVQGVVTMALGTMPKIRAQRELIVQHLPIFDIQELDQLETYALALGHTQATYHSSMEPLPSIEGLAEQATQSREILFAEVSMLVKRGLVPVAILNGLKGANGYKNIGFDVLTLSDVMKRNWDKTSSRTKVTKEELDQAEIVADQLVTAVGLREQSPAIQAAAMRERQAAFSLFVNTYDEVRAAIMYVRRKQDDVDSIAPSLYAGRGNHKKPPAAAAANTQGTQAPAPTDVTKPVTTSDTTSAPKAPSAEVANHGPFMQ